RGRAVERIWQLDKVPTMSQLGVTVQCLTVLHCACWDTASLEHGFGLRRTVLPRPGRHDRIQSLTVHEAGSQRGKPRVVAEFRAPHDLAKRLPLGLGAHRNGQPAVLASGWIHAMRCQMRIRISHPLLTM